MNENNLAHTLLAMVEQEAALADQEQTPDLLRQRWMLLNQIQEIMEEIKDAASNRGGA